MKPRLTRNREHQGLKKTFALLTLASLITQPFAQAQDHGTQNESTWDATKRNYGEFTSGDCLKNLKVEQLDALEKIRGIQDKIMMGKLGIEEGQAQMEDTIQEASKDSNPQMEQLIRSMSVAQTAEDNQAEILAIQYRMAYPDLPGNKPAIRSAGERAIVEALKGPPTSEPDPEAFLMANAKAAKPAWDALAKYDIKMSVDEQHPSKGLQWDYGYADLMKATKDPQFNAAMSVFFDGFNDQVAQIQDPERRDALVWGDKVFLPPKKRWGKQYPVVPIMSTDHYQSAVRGGMKMFTDSVRDYYKASNQSSSFGDFSQGLLTDRNPFWGSYDGPTAGQMGMNAAGNAMGKATQYLSQDLGIQKEQVKDLVGTMKDAYNAGNAALDEGYNRTRKNFTVAALAPALPILCGATGGAFCAGMVKSVAVGTAFTLTSVTVGSMIASHYDQGSFICNLGKQWYTRGIDDTVRNIALAPLGPLLSKGAGAVGKYGAVKVLAFTGSEKAAKAVYMSSLTAVGLPGLAGAKGLWDGWKSRHMIEDYKAGGHEEQSKAYASELYSGMFDSAMGVGAYLYSFRGLAHEARNYNQQSITARAMMSKATPTEGAPNVKLNGASQAAVEEELMTSMRGAQEKINPRSPEWRKYAGEVMAKQARMQVAANEAPPVAGNTATDLERFGSALAAENPQIPVSQKIFTRVGQTLKQALGSTWHELGHASAGEDLGSLKGRAISGVDFENPNGGSYKSFSGTVKSVRNVAGEKMPPSWEAEVQLKDGSIRKVSLSADRPVPLYVHEEMLTTATAPKFATAASTGPAPLGVSGEPVRVITKAERKQMNAILKQAGNAKKYSSDVRERVAEQLEREIAAYGGQNPVKKPPNFLQRFRKDPNAFWKMRAETLMAVESSRAGQTFRLDASKIASLSPDENVIVGDGLGGGQEGKILGYKDLGQGRRGIRFKPADGSEEVVLRDSTDVYRIPHDADILPAGNGDSPTMRTARNLDVDPKTNQAIDDLVGKYGSKKLPPEVVEQVRARMEDDAIRFEKNQPVTEGKDRKFWKTRTKEIIAQENARFRTNTKVAGKLVGAATRGVKPPEGVDVKKETDAIVKQLIDEAQAGGKTLSLKDPAVQAQVEKLVASRLHLKTDAPVTPAVVTETPDSTTPPPPNAQQNAIVLRDPNGTALVRVRPADVTPTEPVTIRSSTSTEAPVRAEIVEVQPNGIVKYRPEGQTVVRQLPANQIELYTAPQNAPVLKDSTGTTLVRVNPTEVKSTELVTVRSNNEPAMRGEIVEAQPNGIVKFKSADSGTVRQLTSNQIEVYAKPQTAIVLRDPAGTSLVRVRPTEITPTEMITVRNNNEAPMRVEVVRAQNNGVIEIKIPGSGAIRQLPTNQIEIYTAPQNAPILREPNGTALVRVNPSEVKSTEIITLRNNNEAPVRGEIVKAQPNGIVEFKPEGQSTVRQLQTTQIEVYKPQTTAIVMRDPKGTALVRVTPAEVKPTEIITLRNNTEAPMRGVIVKAQPSGIVEFKPEGQTAVRQLNAKQVEVYAQDNPVPAQVRPIKVEVSKGSRMAAPRNLTDVEIAARATQYEQAPFDKRILDIESRLSAAKPGSKITLSQTQRNAIATVNQVGRGDAGAHRGTSSGVGNRTEDQLDDIYRVLDAAKFTPDQSNILMAEGYIGPPAQTQAQFRTPGTVGTRVQLPGPAQKQLPAGPQKKQLPAPAKPKQLPAPSQQKQLPAPAQQKLLPAPKKPLLLPAPTPQQ